MPTGGLGLVQVDEILRHTKELDASDVLLARLVEEEQISADSAMGAFSLSTSGGIRIPELVG